MDSRVTSVTSSTPLIEVAHKMMASGSHIIAVCDKGRFRGIITERDVVAGIIAAGCDHIVQVASSLMNCSHPIISPVDDIIRAAMAMINSGVQSLPVVQHGKLLGMFTLEKLAHENQAVASLVFSKISKAETSETSGC